MVIEVMIVIIIFPNKTYSLLLLIFDGPPKSNINISF
jgi:hypothetical protein